MATRKVVWRVPVRKVITTIHLYDDTQEPLEAQVKAWCGRKFDIAKSYTGSLDSEEWIFQEPVCAHCEYYWERSSEAPEKEE